MPPRWAALRALAEKATPEEWSYDGKFTVGIPHEKGDTFFRTNPEDAAYIASAHPRAILALLAENERLGRCADVLRELIDALPASIPGKEEGPLLVRAREALRDE